jgi:hypothetical protein
MSFPAKAGNPAIAAMIFALRNADPLVITGSSAFADDDSYDFTAGK